MKFRRAFLLALAAAVAALAAPADDKEPLFPQRLNVNPPPIATDKTVKYDYDIVYVRAPAQGRRRPQPSGPRSPTRPSWTPAPT